MSVAWYWLFAACGIGIIIGVLIGENIARNIVTHNLRCEGWSKEAIKKKCFSYRG